MSVLPVSLRLRKSCINVIGPERNLLPKLGSLRDKLTRHTNRRQTGLSVPSSLIPVRNQTPVTDPTVVRSSCLVYKCWRKSNLCWEKKTAFRLAGLWKTCCLVNEDTKRLPTNKQCVCAPLNHLIKLLVFCSQSH